MDSLQCVTSYPLDKLPRKLKQFFVVQLGVWYQAHRRHLPWRSTIDPYKIWLSEVILQQTRIMQGLPYYLRFVAKYPTVQDLASADEHEVLRLWQGLGYYTRARNMHVCARSIVSEWGGVFPRTYKELLRLSGVGPYTAGAIASIAFQEAVPVVDGNVYRVLARVFGVEADITSTQGKKVFYTLAHALVPQEDAGVYNQSIMEFGALHCTPVLPKCKGCIFSMQCVALHTNSQHLLPVKTRKIKVKQRFFHYLVIQCADKLYMKPRTTNDIWQGLYDFYLIEDKQLNTLDQLKDALILLIKQHAVSICDDAKPYRHLLTHQRLHVQFLYVQATDRFMQAATPLLDQANMHAFTVDQVKELPKPVLIDNFLKSKFYI